MVSQMLGTEFSRWKMPKTTADNALRFLVSNFIKR